MKESIEVRIQEDTILISSPYAREGDEAIDQPVSDLSTHLIRLAGSKSPSSVSVLFYISEDLLFFKKLFLPLQTGDIKEAVSYQLAILAPFDGEILHSFTTVREKGGYRICLYALSLKTVGTYLDQAASAGFKLVGLFPESQRYVSRQNKQSSWALVMPGRFPKLLDFSGNNLSQRLLCHSSPTREGMATLTDSEHIYSPQPQEGGFDDASILLSENPLHKEFNLLPATYRRPDYIRYFLLALCVLNICALLSVGIIKGYKVRATNTRLQAEIQEILPHVKEVEQLRLEDQQLSGSVDKIEGIGQNFDIIRFLEKVTNVLPSNCYLDQIRLDQKTGDISLQGYTDDLTTLTTELENLGQAKLKSTRRRKNKTYFHVEVNSK